jgi:hypothetical protein
MDRPRPDTLTSVTDTSGPADRDPVVDAYKPGIDRTLLVENLKRTPEERVRNLMALQRFAEELRRAGRSSLQRR